jgi:hypothetical protein
MFSLSAITLVVCLSFHFVVVQQVSSEKSLSDLNAQYDKAGPYSIGDDLSPSRRDKLLTEIRGFLWEHWINKRPGQLRVTVYTIEGDPTTYNFFIEKDPRENWFIRAKSESVIAALLKPGEKPRHETTEISYYDIERLDPETGHVISKGEKRQPETYRLRLEHKNGPKEFVW